MRTRKQPSLTFVLTHDSHAVVAAGNQLKAQLSDPGMSDVLARKKARMVLLAGAPGIRAWELRALAELISRPRDAALAGMSAEEAVEHIVAEALARADEIEALAEVGR